MCVAFDRIQGSLLPSKRKMPYQPARASGRLARQYGTVIRGGGGRGRGRVSSPPQLVSFPGTVLHCCFCVFHAAPSVFALLIAKVLSEFRLALGEFCVLSVLPLPWSTAWCRKVGLSLFLLGLRFIHGGIRKHNTSKTVLVKAIAFKQKCRKSIIII